MESRPVVVKGWGERKIESDCLMDTGFPFGVMTRPETK